MAEEPKDNLVGAYTATAPSFNPSSYTTYEALLGIVKEVIFTADKDGGVLGSLSNSDPAEAWYDLEFAVNDATKRLGEVNEKFATEVKNMRDYLKGDAGDAFDKYATDMLNESEEVFTTLDSKHYGTTIGNIGHVIQATSAAWWDAVRENAKDLKSQQDMIKDAGIKGINDLASLSDEYNNAEIQQLINKVADETTTAVNNASTESKDKLVKRLQELLTSLSNQYADRGQELVPIRIVNGEIKSKDSRYKSSENNNNNNNNNNNENNDEDDDENNDSTGGGNGKSEKYNEGLDDAKDKVDDALDDAIENEDDPEKKQALEDAKKAADGAIDGLKNGKDASGASGAGETTPGIPTEKMEQGKLSPMEPAIPATSSGGPSAGGSPGGESGGGDSGAGERQQALEDAKKAAGDAIDGLQGAGGGEDSAGGGAPAGGGMPGGGSSGAGGGSDPAAAKRAKALEDAKKAAGDAIEGLEGAGGGADSGGGAGSPGGGESLSPDQQKAVDDAKKAVGDAIDGLSGQTDDPARKAALEDAKKAAQDAIGDIGKAGGSGSGLPSTSSDGPGGSGQALEDAKKAAGDAIDGLKGDGQPADPETAKALQDAKDTTGKAFDDLIAGTDDPQQKQALLDAKEAAEDAIDKLIDPQHAEAVGDAKDAASDAIDKLGAGGDSPGQQQAIQDARNAARDAIDGLDSALDPNDPGYQKSIDDAKSHVDDAIDKLAQPGDNADRTAALQQAKDAAHKAIDDIAAKSSAGLGDTKSALGGSKSALDDFLSGGGGGGKAGGGGGGVGIPEIGGGGAGGAETNPAKFDVADQRGLSAPGGQFAAASAGAPLAASSAMSPGSGGMPMGGGMGGGGMGGAGGGKGNSEREPQIWMQADPGAWGEDGENEAKTVLGRD